MSARERLFVVAGLLVAIGLALGWRGGTAPAEASVSLEGKFGRVDVFRLVERMLATERYAREREEEQNSWVARLQEVQESAQAIADGLKVIPEDDPKVAEINTQLLQKRDEINQISVDAQTALERLRAGQLSRAQELIISSVRLVARTNGYTFVLSSRDAREPIEAANMTAGVQELLARTVLVMDGDDLTEMVADELKLYSESEAEPETP